MSNMTAAYLVLACFSQRDNQTTNASVNAIERYTSISRGRAKETLARLCEAGFVRQLKGGSYPQYLLSKTPSTNAELIWLPNTIVTGAGNETPPIERIRETHDPLLFRLFVDLYHEQNLAEDGGVRRDLLWETYSRQKIGEFGQYTIWGFNKGGQYIRLGTLFDPHKEVTEGNPKSRGDPAFSRLATLTALGLLEWLPVVFDANPEENPEAESRFPIGKGGSDELHDRVGAAVDSAAIAMLAKLGLSTYGYDYAVPLPRHLRWATLFGVARLRYRARTALTAAWWAKYSARCEECIREYQNLALAHEIAPVGYSKAGS
jgi:hypothetical protein